MLVEKIKMEFLGTFLLVYLTGMTLIQFMTQAVDKVSLAISNFVIYAILMWCGKAISGSQFNPVISLSLMVSKHIKIQNGIVFIVSQLIASIFAISLLKVTNPADVLTEIKETSIIGFPIITLNPLKGILLEAIGTFFFVIAYYSLLLERNAPKFIYGMGIGSVYFVDTLFLFEKTGCSLNPLRSLAYAMISNNYTNLYIYIVGPLFGGLLGCFLGNTFLTEKAEQAHKREKKDKIKRRGTAIKRKNSNTLQ